MSFRVSCSALPVSLALLPVVWGWDVAKSQDWTVGIGLDAHGVVCAIERWQLKPWAYTIEQIAQRATVPTLIDSTGVGDPVVEEVQLTPGKRPLFVLLDATWTEARKMFRKSPYLDALPVLSLTPAQLSRYRLRRSTRGEHLCTAEVAAMCLELAGDSRAGEALDDYLDAFSQHYLAAKRRLPLDLNDALHQRLQGYR